MTNYILGGGLVALLAKIINPSYVIIPIGKSILYSLNPPLAQDNIIVHHKIDETMLSFSSISPIVSRNALSIGGQLLFKKNQFISNYIEKVYGPDYHTIAADLLPFEHFSYTMKAHLLYKILQNKFITELTENNKDYGRPIRIDDSIIHFETFSCEYDNIISTIPLAATAGLCNVVHELPSRDIYYTYIHAPSVNLEGAETAYVADQEIPFYRVSQRADNCYMIESSDKLELKLLKLFINDATILQQTSIANALPIGSPPSLTTYENLNIHCVGSRAQHDDFMDVSSCIKRLVTGIKPRV